MQTIPPTKAAGNAARQAGNGLRSNVAILAIDNARDGAKAALAGWLGEKNAAAVRALGLRYAVVLTIDQGARSDPRYAHTIDCIPDLPTVIDALNAAQYLIRTCGDAFGLASPGTPGACLADVRLRLSDADTTVVDTWIDERARDFLRRADAAAGHA